MHKLLLVLCALAAIAPAVAAHSPTNFPSNSSRTLKARALQATDQPRETRPTGQCIVSCDDRLVTLKRCADGDCPEFDCKTGVINCGRR